MARSAELRRCRQMCKCASAGLPCRPRADPPWFRRGWVDIRILYRWRFPRGRGLISVPGYARISTRVASIPYSALCTFIAWRTYIYLCSCGAFFCSRPSFVAALIFFCGTIFAQIAVHVVSALGLYLFLHAMHISGRPACMLLVPLGPFYLYCRARASCSLISCSRTDSSQRPTHIPFTPNYPTILRRSSGAHRGDMPRAVPVLSLPCSTEVEFLSPPSLNSKPAQEAYPNPLDRNHVSLLYLHRHPSEY
ncbi:hypothetical protein B0H10DRAFT_1241634 [Mycena sp. CBHHK59/15]|nr:hypothetical protein B0H10DRAFT_1241634 [Mycena sp. CBHHK59/15]